MRLLELNLTHFGKFHNKLIQLSPGVNVIEGRNEAGKSTIHTFIYAMLFGLDAEGEDRENYAHYLPWDKREEYGGWIRFEEESHEYFLERSFLKENPTIYLRDETDKRELVPAGSELNRLLGGLTKSGYRNTVSIGQMQGATDERLAEELKKSASGLSAARNMEINLSAASDTLMRKRKEFEKKIVPDAEAEEAQILASIYQIEEELTRKQEEELEISKRISTGENREYEEFSTKQEESKKLKDTLEEISQEKTRLVHEKERWQREKETAIGNMGKRIRQINDVDLESGEEPAFMRSHASAVYVLGIIALLYAIVCLVSYGLSLFDYSSFIIYDVYQGAVAVGVAIVFICIGSVLSSRHRKHMSFYRLVVDKHMRLKEAETALSAIENKRTSVIRQLSEEASSEYNALHEDNEKLKKELSRISWEEDQILERLNNEKKRLAIVENSCSKNETCRKEITAIRLAAENLFRAADDIQNTFGDELDTCASNYICELTDGAYTKIKVDANAGITLTTEDRDVPLKNVSRGTIEQAYLCVRLAAADVLSPDVSMPILLDDTFAYYDDVRTKTAIEILKTSNHQVILMTCQEREKRLMNKN